MQLSLSYLDDAYPVLIFEKAPCGSAAFGYRWIEQLLDGS